MELSKIKSKLSLTSKTIQGKLRVKDHLIKTMADHLRELSRKKTWEGSTKLESAVKSDSAITYDWDRTSLLQYIEGKEPHNYVASMKGSEGNPLNVKIVNKVDDSSLLIDWGPSPSAETIGFQIYLNGMFKYWIHSSKRNKALLHPLDLKSLLEIAVCPIDVKGKVILRSIIVYKPD